MCFWATELRAVLFLFWWIHFLKVHIHTNKTHYAHIQQNVIYAQIHSDKQSIVNRSRKTTLAHFNVHMFTIPDKGMIFLYLQVPHNRQCIYIFQYYFALSFCACRVCCACHSIFLEFRREEDLFDDFYFFFRLLSLFRLRVFLVHLLLVCFHRFACFLIVHSDSFNKSQRNNA